MSNLPPGCSDNDPEFDMPSVHDDEDDELEAALVGYMQRLQANSKLNRYHRVEMEDDDDRV
jgi:hypothetical protein